MDMAYINVRNTVANIIFLTLWRVFCLQLVTSLVCVFFFFFKLDLQHIDVILQCIILLR